MKEILAQAPLPPIKQFVLFGDSITQGCFNQERGFALGAQLAHDYARKLDVVNRGMKYIISRRSLEIF